MLRHTCDKEPTFVKVTSKSVVHTKLVFSSGPPVFCRQTEWDKTLSYLLLKVICGIPLISVFRQSPFDMASLTPAQLREALSREAEKAQHTQAKEEIDIIREAGRINTLAKDTRLSSPTAVCVEIKVFHTYCGKEYELDVERILPSLKDIDKVDTGTLVFADQKVFVYLSFVSSLSLTIPPSPCVYLSAGHIPLPTVLTLSIHHIVPSGRLLRPREDTVQQQRQPDRTREDRLCYPASPQRRSTPPSCETHQQPP